MAKFVLVKDYDDLEKILNYIDKNRKNNYYIAPKLMYDLLSSFKYRCVIGIDCDNIKNREHQKIDIVTIPVYNKVFQKDVFRIDAINSHATFLSRLINDNIEFESIVFGIDDDLSEFMCCDVEEIS